MCKFNMHGCCTFFFTFQKHSVDGIYIKEPLGLDGSVKAVDTCKPPALTNLVGGSYISTARSLGGSETPHQLIEMLKMCLNLTRSTRSDIILWIDW
uniref:Uncharacterized protein n=1 Tax=Arundo donax TaxID=35708 RepID=A0A0A8YFW8_ARUDO